MQSKIYEMEGGFKSIAVTLAAGLALAAAAAAETVTFGTDANQFSITFNAVNDSLKIGNTEILRSDYTKFYALTHSGAVYADNVGRTASETQCRITGLQLVDMINWLNTSSGFPAAYTFNGAHGALVNWDRNPGAKFFLPTEAEWNLGYTLNHYAPGPCAFEWIQDTDGVGYQMDGVDDGSPNKTWNDGLGSQYNDTGFRVVQVLHPPGPLDHFEVTASSPQGTGTAFSVTVTAKDIDGKTISTDSTTPVTMTSNTGHAQFDSDGNGTFGDNIKTLSSGTFTITTKDAVAESVTFTATGGDKTGSSSAITVSAPPPPEIVSFGTGTTQFSLTFSQVTAACNMGDTEVLNDAFNKFYLATKGVAYAANTGLALTDTACNVSGIEVVDFINWLNTSSGLPAAYTFNPAHDSLLNWNRTPRAKFFLPTVAEWNGALAYLTYAPGPCTDEWIQDTGGGGDSLDGVMDGAANKSWDDGFNTSSYGEVGFRVISDPNVSLTTQSPFNAWIAGAPQTGFADDPNQDGVANGLAWLLHGTAMGNSRTCLPLATTAAGKLVLSFQCLKASARGTAVLNVQYSKDLGVLDAWHTAAVPDVTSAVNGVVFTVTPITASDYQTITAEIPLSAASSDGKLFGRLQGTE